MRSPTRYFRRRTRSRRGSIIVLTAVLMIILMALLALSIDVGYIYSMKTQLDRSVDAAALAGTSELIEGETAAQDMIVEYLARNPLGNTTSITVEGQIEAIKAQWLEDHEEELDVLYGYWNPETRELESAVDPTAVKVVVARANLPLFFARIFGRDRVMIESSSVATYKPREIMLVLDLSASMNDDSELKSIDLLGREVVENNLADIYYELDSPQYGNLEFTPDFVTVVGVPPAADTLPQITVEYRGDSLHITSTKDILNVVMELEDGTVCTADNLTAGTLETTMTAGQMIQRLWVEAGENAQYFASTNGYGEPFDFSNNTTFLTALQLTDEPYPYSAGSWNEYVDYIRSAESANANAGYRNKFGHLNLLNYWLDRYPAYNQTSDLWKVSAQPLATVKDAVELFVDYVREVNTRDRIGLAVYNSATGDGSVEVPLTYDLDQIINVTRERQAGHYHSMTNIGGGLESAIDELHQNGRDGAFKMVVLLTDGVANWSDGVHDTGAANSHAVSQAIRAHELKQKVMTISLGLGADTTLMQQVADIAEGIHFNVPGGATVDQTRDALIDAFREIARKRPVTLVE
jgi:hypothetical protein